MPILPAPVAPSKQEWDEIQGWLRNVPQSLRHCWPELWRTVNGRLHWPVALLHVVADVAGEQQKPAAVVETEAQQFTASINEFRSELQNTPVPAPVPPKPKPETWQEDLCRSARERQELKDQLKAKQFEELDERHRLEQEQVQEQFYDEMCGKCPPATDAQLNQERPQNMDLDHQIDSKKSKILRHKMRAEGKT